MQENRAYQAGLASIGLFFIAAVFGTLGLMSETFINAIGMASFLMTVIALLSGRKELLADPKNKKSKIGLIIGIVMLSMQVIAVVVMVFLIML
ncbi:hypothetical protein [Acetobacterium bakii]|uniref:DUF4190 domain-containing protein n=1 Tax=Acetobacterium bakii TaxID=52689 RepID=A0A0L6U6Z7_9FIRM|nr:hypothetical protein [Acetobacterium bakii]KNZ43570.1 hypothetical protein AKG39_00585 [Acetobacterium bakii]